MKLFTPLYYCQLINSFWLGCGIMAPFLPTLIIYKNKHSSFSSFNSIRYMIMRKTSVDNPPADLKVTPYLAASPTNVEMTSSPTPTYLPTTNSSTKLPRIQCLGLRQVHDSTVVISNDPKALDIANVVQRTISRETRAERFHIPPIKFGHTKIRGGYQHQHPEGWWFHSTEDLSVLNKNQKSRWHHVGRIMETNLGEYHVSDPCYQCWLNGFECHTYSAQGRISIASAGCACTRCRLTNSECSHSRDNRKQRKYHSPITSIARSNSDVTLLPLSASSTVALVDQRPWVI